MTRNPPYLKHEKLKSKRNIHISNKDKQRTQA